MRSGSPGGRADSPGEEAEHVGEPFPGGRPSHGDRVGRCALQGGFPRGFEEQKRLAEHVSLRAEKLAGEAAIVIVGVDMIAIATTTHLSEARGRVPAFGALNAGVEVAQVRSRLAPRLGQPPTPRTAAYELFAIDEMERILSVFGRR